MEQAEKKVKNKEPDQKDSNEWTEEDIEKFFSFFADLASKQRDLPPDVAKILYDHLWEL